MIVAPNLLYPLSKESFPSLMCHEEINFYPAQAQSVKEMEMNIQAIHSLVFAPNFTSCSNRKVLLT